MKFLRSTGTAAPKVESRDRQDVDWPLGPSRILQPGAVQSASDLETHLAKVEKAKERGGLRLVDAAADVIDPIVDPVGIHGRGIVPIVDAAIEVVPLIVGRVVGAAGRVVVRVASPKKEIIAVRTVAAAAQPERGISARLPGVERVVVAASVKVSGGRRSSLHQRWMHSSVSTSARHPIPRSWDELATQCGCEPGFGRGCPVARATGSLRYRLESLDTERQM